MTFGKAVALGLVIAFAAIQLVPVERTNPPIRADLRADPDVKSVLRVACYDCHSNETKWPWYGRVAPVSWLLHRDVTKGRAELNFSDWESLPPNRRSELQQESMDEIDDGDMPPRLYTWLHPRATLSDLDKAALRRWVESAP